MNDLYLNIHGNYYNRLEEYRTMDIQSKALRAKRRNKLLLVINMTIRFNNNKKKLINKLLHHNLGRSYLTNSCLIIISVYLTNPNRNNTGLYQVLK